MPTKAQKLLAAERRLTAINGRIDRHPLNSAPMKEARDYASEHRSEGRETVDKALAERGLPTTVKQGRALALGLVSLAGLNRKRIKLERQITRLGADETP